MTVFSATSDAFDDSRTGYYPSAEEALRAFWSENYFSPAEATRAKPYTVTHEVDTALKEDATWLAARGSPSPALGEYLA